MKLLVCGKEIVASLLQQLKEEHRLDVIKKFEEEIVYAVRRQLSRICLSSLFHRGGTAGGIYNES